VTCLCIRVGGQQIAGRPFFVLSSHIPSSSLSSAARGRGRGGTGLWAGEAIKAWWMRSRKSPGSCRANPPPPIPPHNGDFGGGAPWQADCARKVNLPLRMVSATIPKFVSTLVPCLMYIVVYGMCFLGKLHFLQ
jgi:hypothetical protein